MFDLLTKLVDILLRGAEHRERVARSHRRTELLLDLLTVYFILLEIAKTGDRLVGLAGDDPILRVSSMAMDDANKWLVECKYLMWGQRNNLGRLGDLLLYEGLPVLDILDPNLRAELLAIVGSKEKGLFAIGAALEIYMTFGAIPTDEEVRTYGGAIAGLRYGAEILESLLSSPGTPLEARKVIAELDVLRRETERLRGQIVALCSSDELLILAAQAERRAKSERSLHAAGKFGPIIIR